MEARNKVQAADLALPQELLTFIGGAPIYESSGKSGARTVLIDQDGGAYLKIAGRGSLSQAARMQAYFAEKKMSPPVLNYLSADRDYLLTASLAGEDGTAEKYLSQPKRLSEMFGRSLRTLHDLDFADCPIQNRMSEWIGAAKDAVFLQPHLDAVSAHIAGALSSRAAEEIAATSGLLKNDALLHGDYCLPNIILNNWEFSGLIDVADGGVGDRHYDLAWGLWTLSWNLQSQKYGQYFLGAYGEDAIDPQRLRLCGLLAAMD